MIGRTIGNYKILEKLSRDEKIAVYKAVDIPLSRNVLIKVLDEKLLNQTRIVDDFRFEAATLAKLDHKSIPRLHALTEVDGELFMISEYLEGETLDRFLFREGTVSFEKAVSIFTQVFDCLEYTHKNGIAHGCLETSRIMLTDAGNVKNLGFGANGKDSFAETINDKNKDIHALAAMLYESLSGQTAPIAEEEFDAKIPQNIETVIRKVLLSSSVENFKSVAEFHNALIVAGFTISSEKVQSSAQNETNDLEKPLKKSVKSQLSGNFIIINPVAESEDLSYLSTNKIDSKPIYSNELNLNQPLALSRRKPLQTRYKVAGAAIFAVLVLHFVWQFSFIQNENLRMAENSLKTIQPIEQTVENKTNIPPVEAKPENQIAEVNTKKPSAEVKEVKKDSAPKIFEKETSEKSIQSVTYRQPIIKPVPSPISKKATRESKNERLRRAEKLLTGM